MSIAADPLWIPDYQSAAAAPAAAPAPVPVARTASAPQALNRSTTFNTLNNIADLKGWLAEKAIAWTSGAKPTVTDYSEGHALVYKICTESTQPKDAENQCYMLYLDYCRGIAGQFEEGKQRRAATQALKGIFKYLDQHFCNTKDRPGMVRTKQPTSKLCAGQDLKTSAAAIADDAMWIPDYQAAPASEAAPVAPAGLYRAASAPKSLARVTSINTLAILTSRRLGWPPSLPSSW